MITPNLNPGQLARLRPQSASLRTPRSQRAAEDPSFARLREGEQATPRLPPKPEAPPGEEDPWLFGFPRCLTTAELWRMGFAQAILLNASGWGAEATAASEISGALKARPLKGLSAEHKEDLESAIAPAFLGGDVVIVVACQGLDALPADESARCVAHLSRFLDCVSTVWSQYDAMEDDRLGAVVAVLEGFSQPALAADWANGEEPMAFPVTPLDESLAPHFA